MRGDLQEHHQLPSVNNLILAFGKFLSIPVLNRLCTSIPFCLLVTAMLQCWNIHRTEYKTSQIHLDWEVGVLCVIFICGYAHCSPAYKMIVGNTKLLTNKSVKTRWFIALSWSVVRKTFLYLSYWRKHQLFSASVGADSNRSEFSLSWQR